MEKRLLLVKICKEITIYIKTNIIKVVDSSCPPVYTHDIFSRAIHGI